MSAASAPPVPRTADELREPLRRFLAGCCGVAPDAVRIGALARMAGGASREIWRLEVSIARAEGATELDLVMRRDPPGRGDEGSRDLEFRLVDAAHQAGVPVPRVHWCCTDPAVLGTAFYLMDRVDGEALPRRLLRDERYRRTREGLTAELGAILARIHAMDPDQPALAGLVDTAADGAGPGRAEIDRVSRGIAAMAAEPHPVLALAERWLRERVPAASRRTLVHGDFRVGNVLFDETGVRAILDWELAKIGDPVEDLGWLCAKAWRFGSPLPVGGVGRREALLEAYAAAGGGSVDPAHLRFWEAMASYKVALVWIQQSWVHRTGRVASLELAALGRRIAEEEEALLDLMEERA
jgi:aminoglycoside phosphotransferase (APT) family kinase protein